jgi:hypothetical protein
MTICDYCQAKLKSNNGTTSMTSHTNKYKSIPNNEANKRHKTTSSTTHVTSHSAIVAENFDEEKCRHGVVAMVVEMELFVSACEPQIDEEKYDIKYMCVCV